MIHFMLQMKRIHSPAISRAGSIAAPAAFSVLIFLAVLAGCSTPAREEVFEGAGPTTEQVWHGTGPRTGLLGDSVSWNPAGPSPSAPGAAAWTRSAENELDLLFPTLHNPRISLYVFPHLSADGAPVPGYVTGFFLFREAGIFALPGEAFRQGTWR